MYFLKKSIELEITIIIIVKFINQEKCIIIDNDTYNNCQKFHNIVIPTPLNIVFP